MMTKEEILKLRDAAEQTRVQFKERITRDNKYDVCCEMVAQSNTHGGLIVVGIEDKAGCVHPLTFHEAQKTTNLLGSLATEGVVPQILIDIENVQIENGVVIVAYIKEGKNKPYRDGKGIIWVKQGADKRKVFDNAELIAMLMENRQIHPDSMPVNGTNINDLDEKTVKNYLIKRFRNDFERQEFTFSELQHKSLNEIATLIHQTTEGILKNNGLVMSDGRLTLASLMLMGKYPQRWLPAFTVRCVSFVGNNIGGTEFRDKSGGDADGNAVHLYHYIMSFLTRNLRQKQVEKDFNSPGALEVSSATLSEMVVNSILHRSYVIEAPLRVFIFDNRIEIHSPGLLPEGVSMESIRHGVSVPRNRLLFNHGINLLPYTGAGSGIIRALQFTPDIMFKNDETANEFVVILLRKMVEDNNEKNVKVDDKNDVSKKANNKHENNRLSNPILTLPEESDDKKKSEVRNKKMVEDNDEVVPHKKHIPYKFLSGTQKNIIQYCSIARAYKEILNHLGYKYHSRYMSSLIKPLLDIGYLELTIPDKPKSKNQKYRKVKKR